MDDPVKPVAPTSTYHTDKHGTELYVGDVVSVQGRVVAFHGGVVQLTELTDKYPLTFSVGLGFVEKVGGDPIPDQFHKFEVGDKVLMRGVVQNKHYSTLAIGVRGGAYTVNVPFDALERDGEFKSC